MSELIIKMTYWLITAMVLGFIVSWLLARVFYQRQASSMEKSLLDALPEQESVIKKLEKEKREKDSKPITPQGLELKRLKELDKKRVEELEAFEEIVLLSESKVQESKKIIQNLETKIRAYEDNRLDEAFIISKDQITQIEAQLKKYQKEIDLLKNEKLEKVT